MYEASKVELGGEDKGWAILNLCNVKVVHY